MLNWDALMPAVDGQGADEIPVATPLSTASAREVPQDNPGTAVDASYPAHPAAVLLVLAWCRLKATSPSERCALLLDLESLPPADQVRYWHAACVLAGLKPWQVLYLPAPTWGDDCTRCKHLTTREEAIGEARRRCHWACARGYLVLEHGRGSERVLVSPPECASFERWYPGPWR